MAVAGIDGGGDGGRRVAIADAGDRLDPRGLPIGLPCRQRCPAEAFLPPKKLQMMFEEAPDDEMVRMPTRDVPPSTFPCPQ